jgi:hypothetical protein
MIPCVGGISRALTDPRALRALNFVLSRAGPLRSLWFRLLRLGDRVTIVCISKDDPELIATVYEHHRRLGVGIWVVLDARSTERSKAVLDNRRIPYTSVENPEDYVEPLIGRISAQTKTEWLLVLNNDELLNLHALLEVSLRAAFDRVNDCLGIPRSWVLLRHGKPYVAESDFFGSDYQWRLIRHERVGFHGRIHTPGFEVPPGRSEVLTPASRMYHFDWVVRSEAYRREKIEFYAAKLPHTRQELFRYYLPETSMDELELAPMRERGTRKAMSEYARHSDAA